MKKICNIFIVYFLFVIILTGCGTADPVSNSSGTSTPSSIILSVEVNPASVDSGGSATITATTMTSGSGTPAADVTVYAVSGSGGSLDNASLTTNSSGQAFFTLETVTAPTTVTLTVEDVSVSIRVNVNG